MEYDKKPKDDQVIAAEIWSMIKKTKDDQGIAAEIWSMIKKKPETIRNRS